jgi:hypothetical protein
MREWELKTFLPETPTYLTTLKGVERDGRVWFPHPSDDSIVLDVAIGRAMQMADWPSYRKTQSNIRLSWKDSSIGKEYRNSIESGTCPHCGTIVVWFDSGTDAIHGIPQCGPYKKRGTMALKELKSV